MQDFTISRLHEGLRLAPVRVVIGTVALFALIWIVLGLISLRFNVVTSMEDVAYSQLIVLGCLLIAFANAYVMQSGGFNRNSERSIWQFVSYCPVASAGTAIVGMLLLIWPVWTSFSSVEPNRLLQLMFTLIALGLCGTFAGFVSLANVARFYRILPWALYILTVVLAVEIGESLWRVDRLQAATTGDQAGMIGTVIITATVVYAIIAAFMGSVATERSRIMALICYFVAGLGGFTLGVGALWDSLEAGAHRLVLGVAMLLSMGAVGLALLHYYNLRPPGFRARPKVPYVDSPSPGEEERETTTDTADPYSPCSPYFGGTTDPSRGENQQAAEPDLHLGPAHGGSPSESQGTPGLADVLKCPSCGNLNTAAARFCRLCGSRLTEERPEERQDNGN